MSTAVAPGGGIAATAFVHFVHVARVRAFMTLFASIRDAFGSGKKHAGMVCPAMSNVLRRHQGVVSAPGRSRQKQG